MADYRQNVWRFCELFPDVLRPLERIRYLGLKTAILTNGTVECQGAKIEALGLIAFFDAVLISEREGIKKPESAFFLRACEGANLQPRECLMVGDSLKADIQGALDAGLQAIFLNRDEVDVPVTVRAIRSLMELGALV